MIKLKKSLIDEIGFSYFLSSGFEPKYEYYTTEDELIIKVEIPGEIENMKLKRKTEGSYTYINLKGNKVNKEEKSKNKDNLFNKREYGEFNINIKLEKIILDSSKKEIKIDKGITTIIYKLGKNSDSNL